MSQDNPLRYGIKIPVETRAMMAAQTSHSAVHKTSLELRRYVRLAGHEVTDVEEIEASLELAREALETAIKAWGEVVNLFREGPKPPTGTGIVEPEKEPVEAQADAAQEEDPLGGAEEPPPEVTE